LRAKQQGDWHEVTEKMDESGESDEQKAREFLQAQQHYYRELHVHRQDLAKFLQSRKEHVDAVRLLEDLPKKVAPTRAVQAWRAWSCSADLAHMLGRSP
jgi:hypothetical protein